MRRYLLSIASVILTASVVSPVVAQLELADYRVVGAPIKLAGVEADASGVTFSRKTGMLYVVINGDTSILELSTSGELQRTITLEGFNDTEGIVWIEGNRFAVVEERRRNLCIFDVPPGARSVKYEDAVTYLIDPTPAGNSGLEGVAWDAGTGRFFIVKEKQPRRIYEVHVKAGTKPDISEPWDVESEALGMQDLAGLHYDQTTRHLLFLSDESRCIVESTAMGKEVARLSLTAGSAGLDHDIPQPEGITMDSSQRIYICSEPNLIYIFERQKGK